MKPAVLLILLIDVDLLRTRTSCAAPIILPSPAQWGSACMLFIFATTFFSEMAEITGFAPGPILRTKTENPVAVVPLNKETEPRKQTLTSLEAGLATIADDTPQIAALLMELRESKDRDEVLTALRNAVEFVATYDSDDCLRRILCFLSAGQNEAESMWIDKIKRALEILRTGAARSYLLAIELGNNSASARTCTEVYAVCNVEAEQVALYMLPLKDLS